MEEILHALNSNWMKKIELALAHKKKQFQDDADECMRFYNGPYHWMYGRSAKFSHVHNESLWNDENAPRPTFMATMNKAAEVVQLFGPVLYHRNPKRTVTPRKSPDLPMEAFGDPNDPMVQQQWGPYLQQVVTGLQQDKIRSVLLEHYLNYTPLALDLKTESRNCIDEALIKGMGVLWQEVYYPKSGGVKMYGSFYGSVDDLVIDPDATLLSDAKWVARRCVHPVWQVEREYGLPPGTLKGNAESHASVASNDQYDRARGLTNDVIVYWKVWSKMGMGGKMSGVIEEAKLLDQLGEYAYIVVSEHGSVPINLPETDANGVNIWQDINAFQQRISWETPIWADDGWPFKALSFHWVPGQLWPQSHLKPALGELKFINWAYSFLMGKIKTACRDFIVMAKSVGEEIKRAILDGSDYALIEIEKAHGTISEIVGFLQHPSFQGDIFRVIAAVEDNFDRRTGLTELMYGVSKRQLRSASEAEIKADQLRVRPDDMSNKVEDFMSEVARAEAFGARWHLEPQDVQPVMGDLGAYFWAQTVSPVDPGQLLHQLEYRVEAGSARKPNREKDVSDANSAIQTLFQPFWQYAQATGNVAPVNAIISMWAKANEMEVQPLLLPTPPPPQPAQPGPPGEGSAPSA